MSPEPGRLTLWYGAILSVILVGFCAAVYLLMQRHLLTLTDAALHEELDEIEGEVKRVESLGQLPAALKLRFPGYEGYELQVGTLTGTPLFRSAGLGANGLPGPRALPTKGLDEPVYESVILNGQNPVRLASGTVPGPSGDLLIQAAVTLAPHFAPCASSLRFF